MTEQLQRRSSDKGFWCTLALRGRDFWNWVDERDVDKHAVSIAILYGTIAITSWAMEYASASPRPGLEVAAIIAAVGAPYMALQAAVTAWYFQARSK